MLWYIPWGYRLVTPDPGVGGPGDAPGGLSPGGLLGVAGSWLVIIRESSSSLVSALLMGRSGGGGGVHESEPL